MTDNEILSLMRENPPEGHRELFNKYYSYVYAIVNRILTGSGSADDAEECVIDVFASVMMKLVPDENCSLKSYLVIKTGRNVSADDENMAEIADDEDIEEKNDRSETSELLLKKVSELGPPDSIIIIQKYYYDKSSKDIAEMVGLNAVAVRMRCTRAMKRLKKLLEADGITL